MCIRNNRPDSILSSGCTVYLPFEQQLRNVSGSIHPSGSSRSQRNHIGNGSEKSEGIHDSRSMSAAGAANLIACSIQSGIARKILATARGSTCAGGSSCNAEIDLDKTSVSNTIIGLNLLFFSANFAFSEHSFTISSVLDFRRSSGSFGHFKASALRSHKMQRNSRALALPSQFSATSLYHAVSRYSSRITSPSFPISQGNVGILADFPSIADAAFLPLLSCLQLIADNGESLTTSSILCANRMNSGRSVNCSFARPIICSFRCSTLLISTLR